MFGLLRKSTIPLTVAVLGLVASLVLVMASPAAAASGSGSGGTGTILTPLTVVEDDPPCARVDPDFSHSAVVSSGTYNFGGGTSYSGSVTLQWTTAQPTGVDYYEGPEGTHGSDSTCSNAAGTTWNVNAVSKSTIGTTVVCQYTGTYRRGYDTDGGTPEEADRYDMELDLSGTCSYNGGTGQTTYEDRVSTLGTCYDTGGDPNVPEQCDTSGDAYTASNTDI